RRPGTSSTCPCRVLGATPSRRLRGRRRPCRSHRRARPPALRFSRSDRLVARAMWAHERGLSARRNQERRRIRREQGDKLTSSFEPFLSGGPRVSPPAGRVTAGPRPNEAGPASPPERKTAAPQCIHWTRLEARVSVWELLCFAQQQRWGGASSD